MPAIVSAGMVILLRVWLKDRVAHGNDRKSVPKFEQRTGLALWTLLLWLSASFRQLHLNKESPLVGFEIAGGPCCPELNNV